MNSKTWWSIIAGLFIVIAVMTWLLFATPSTKGPVTGTDSTQPLSARVTVTSPQKNVTVAKSFTVAGSAPGPWFFEASFPIKVIDKDGNTITATHAEAQGDWMTTELVTFTAKVTTDGYVGPATLVLLKDNPSGLPEKDDSVSISITIN